MTLPGPNVTIADAAPPPAILTDTGTAFIVGLSDRGPVGVTQDVDDVLTSMADLVAVNGAVQSYNGLEYTAAKAHFAEGGSRLFFQRYVGPAAVKAAAAVPATSSKFTFTAPSEGAWGNNLKVSVASNVITVAEHIGTADVVQVNAGPFTTIADAQAWFVAHPQYGTLTPLTTGALANSAAISLTGGVDDRNNATDTQRQTAFNCLGKDLGTGQVALPGDTRPAAWALISQHCIATNRFGYCDGRDSDVAADVATDAATQRALGREIARHGQILDGWGYATGDGSTVLTVPPSGVMLGLAARNDANGNPNTAVAGSGSVSRFLTSLKRKRTDADRELLANAGVTVFVNRGGAIQPYDDVTPVDPIAEPEWLGAAGNRMVMRIVQDATAIADAHMFGSVSGPPDINAFNGDLVGMLNFWFLERALYSADGTAAGAFRVETGSSVNTPTTLAQRKLRAALALKLAPNTRVIEIPITNTPLQSAL